ncbi:MAG: GIY-YIG nuclease family protein [bacterium]|nr:GIY-YIG nuclease family protein [bacterium]
MKFFVYALYNSAHDRIYVGQTENLELRITMHSSKFFKNAYTSKFSGSWNLFYQESFSTRRDALKREKQLKSFRGREFLKKKLKSKNP